MSTPEDRQRRPSPRDQPTDPQPGEPGYYDPDSQPATVGDVRNLRRWMIVALVWAVAASAIALLALLDDDTAEDDSASDSGSVTRVERRLDQRIDELDQRVERAPSSSDLEDLSGRVDEVEGQVEGLGDAPSEDSINQINERIDELEQRVEDLEENQPPPEGGTP